MSRLAVVVVAVAVLIATAFGFLWGRAGRGVAAVGGGEVRGTAELEARLSRIEERLAALQSERREPPDRVETSEARLPSAGDTAEVDVDALAQRVAKNEAELRRLGEQYVALGPVPETLPAIKKALEDRNLNVHRPRPEFLHRRMELRRRLLELAPGDPAASEALRGLKTDYLNAGNGEAALRLLDQYRAAVVMPSWQLDLEYASTFGFLQRSGDEREAYGRVIGCAGAPEHQRASAKFWFGYSYYREGRYAEAREQFEALISQYGEDPPPTVRNSVGGAVNHLEKIKQLASQGSGR